MKIFIAVLAINLIIWFAGLLAGLVMLAMGDFAWDDIWKISCALSAIMTFGFLGLCFIDKGVDDG